MTYSLDFRQKVMDYKTKKGLTFEQTSHHFDIGIRTLFRWSSSLSPCNKRQKPATKMDMDALKHDVKIVPMPINGNALYALVYTSQRFTMPSNG